MRSLLLLQIIFLLLQIILLGSCQGKLSDEQRKQWKEGMEASEIRKISEGEITDAAFNLGRKISSLSQNLDATLEDRGIMDSIQNLFSIKIIILKPGGSILHQVEQQIIEAYTSNSNEFTPSDNIQKLGVDSILYTVPILKSTQDGTLEFKYVLGIIMPKKQVVLSVGVD